MLTKYYLHIDTDDYELTGDDIRNWDSVMCSWKRTALDGIARSFSSQFEFVNDAREMLIAAYLSEGVDACVSLSVHTMKEDWTYEERFRCPLDFSTADWDDTTFRINAVDDSLTSLIKANKSTKYEFVVGEDISPDDKFVFDRVPMIETVSYGFTQGESSEVSSDLLVTFLNNELPWLGNIGSEVVIGRKVDWNEDQTNDAHSYVLKALSDVDMKLEYCLGWRTDKGENRTRIQVRVFRDGEMLPIQSGTGGTIGPLGKETELIGGDGKLPDPDQAVQQYQSENLCAVAGGYVWKLQYNGRGYGWSNTGKTPEEYFSKEISGEMSLSLKSNDRVMVTHSFIDQDITSASVMFTRSDFMFRWINRGEKVSIDVFRPEKVGTHLLRKLTGLNVNVSISDFDSRIARTYLMAAESIRGIDGARLYSSFDEFSNWLSTVFGYIYTVGDPMPPRFRDEVKVIGQIESSPWAYSDEPWLGDVDADNLVYIPAHRRILYHDPQSNLLSTYWKGREEYVNGDGTPRTDTLFIISELSAEDRFYFDKAIDDEPLNPRLYEGIDTVDQTVYFVHRSELFETEVSCQFREAKDVKINVDSSLLYSAVTVGYDKKDYEGVNGRDEFNFSNTYSTGCNVTDKTLSLTSKYRADSYGIEFAAQKRGKDTTDSQSDKDVFFALLRRVDQSLLPARLAVVGGSVSDGVFNAEYNPRACVTANLGYIGVTGGRVPLAFASSTGNSDLTIDGVALNADVEIEDRIATSGVLEFSSADVEYVPDERSLIEVIHNGTSFRGYLKDMDFKYAKNEAVKYKLIIKEIEP